MASQIASACFSQNNSVQSVFAEFACIAVARVFCMVAEKLLLCSLLFLFVCSTLSQKNTLRRKGTVLYVERIPSGASYMEPFMDLVLIHFVLINFYNFDSVKQLVNILHQ